MEKFLKCLVAFVLFNICLFSLVYLLHVYPNPDTVPWYLIAAMVELGLGGIGTAAWFADAITD